MSTVFSGSDTVPWNLVEGSWDRISLWARNFWINSLFVFLLKRLPHKLPISFNYINPATSFQYLSWWSPWNLRLPFLYLRLVSLLHKARIRHARNEKGTGAEMRPAIVSGIGGADQLFANFSPVPSNSPLSLCESPLGPGAFSFL